MRAILLTPPDVRRWALESVLRNGGYDVAVFEDAAAAGQACHEGGAALVVVAEPDEGPWLTAGVLGALRVAEPERPAVVAVTRRSVQLAEALGDDMEWVRLAPWPVDGLVLRMVLEDLGLPWGGTPADRPPLSPPEPERPWGLEGMKKGTVDAAGRPTPADG